MRTLYSVLALILIATFLTGCPNMVSTEDLAEEVEQHIRETWATDPNLKTAKIKSFSLVHKGGKQYSGVLEASHYGQNLNLSVDVVYDGERFIWKIVN